MDLHFNPYEIPNTNNHCPYLETASNPPNTSHCHIIANKAKEISNYQNAKYLPGKIKKKKKEETM